MSTFTFDEPIDRRRSDSAKWNFYPEDVLPMWVADMDFRSPPAIAEALHRRVDEEVFGYSFAFSGLLETIVARMQALYGWTIAPESIVLLSGLVSGLNITARAVGDAGDGVLVNTPVYGPFLTAPTNQGRTLQGAAQRLSLCDDGTLRYDVDFEALEAAVEARTRLFFLCSPANPTGRVWPRADLERFAALAERHDLIICSDEIHCDLLLDGARHTPIAALSPEIGERTITLMAPSKTFNIPGLGASLAIIPNKALRERFNRAANGIVPHLNTLGAVAMQAAYAHGDAWLEELRAYLTANRDFVVEFVRERMPALRVTRPEATYLAWLDCRAAELGKPPHLFFLEEARVAVNDGSWFGAGGEGFVRLNFGTTRARLTDGLERMADALARAGR